jgi:hypothetical protein
LPIKPLAGFMVLTFWTVTVTTGHGSPFRPVTFGAMHIELPGIWRAASAYGIDGIQMAGQNPVSVFGHKDIEVLINNRNQIHNYTFHKST